MNCARIKKCIHSKPRLKYTSDEAKDIVVDFCSKESTPNELSQKFKIPRETLYYWKDKYLGKGYTVNMTKSVSDKSKISSSDIENLRKENEKLKQENLKLQIEHDILEKSIEIQKKTRALIMQNYQT